MAARKKAAKSTRKEALDDILVRMVGIVAEVRRRQHAVNKAHGVTMLQLTAIHVLREKGPLNIKQLSEGLHLNQSTVSSLVDRMVRDGLVRRVQSTRDRRSVKLRLTDKAEALADDVPISPFEFFKRLLSTLSKEDLETISSMLERVEGAMMRALEKMDSKARSRKRRRAS